MASAKRARGEKAGCVEPLVDRKAIKARIYVAEKALDGKALRAMAQDLEATVPWLQGTLIKLEDRLRNVEMQCAATTARSELLAAVRALPPGGAVATFNKYLCEELFEGPLRVKGEASEFSFMETHVDIRVAGIPVTIHSKCRGWKLDTVQETYKELTVFDEEEIKAESFAAIKAASIEAIVDLLKRTSMREVIQLDKEPVYDGDGLPPCSYLATADATAYIIFARPTDGWPFIPKTSTP